MRMQLLDCWTMFISGTGCNSSIYFVLNIQNLNNIIFGKANSMKIGDKIKTTIKMSDFFYCTEMLRYDNQMEYRTLTGGLISIGIIITILVGFASMILNTLDLNTISTSLQVTKQAEPKLTTITASPQNHFMFGVQIWHLNLSDSRRYFDVNYYIVEQQHGNILRTDSAPLQPCTKNHWKNVPQVYQAFESLNASGWLCPQIGFNLQLRGKYSSQNYTQYYMMISACNNQTDPQRPCVSPDEIDELFNQNQYLYFDIYFTNPLINSDQKNYKNFYLEDKNYAMFGREVGSETYLYFSDYTISTDYSIWPFANIVQDKGYIVQNIAINHPFPTTPNGTYIVFSMAKSSNSLVYTREVQKLSSVFSFMGGTIGAMSAIFFIIKVYTSLSFQISIALQIFQPKSGEMFQMSMNFFNFLKFYCFKISQMIGRPFSWPTMEYVGQCQRQILHQLDIKSLLKRVIFLQYCLTYLFEDYQLDGLQLKKPRSPEQIKKIRQKCESVENISQIFSGQSQINMQKRANVQNIKTQENGQVLNSELLTPSNILSQRHMPIKNEFKLSAPNSNTINNEMVVIDMLSQSNNFSIPDCQLKQINNQSFRRCSYLNSLKLNAEKGNLISQKIWNQLQQHKKQSQKLQQFT